MYKINGNCYAIGKLTLHIATTNESEIIIASGFTLPNNRIQKFKRLMINNVIFYSTEYSMSGSRDNTLCSFQDQSGGTSYGQIVGFYLLQASQICIVKVFTIAQDSSPLNNIRPSQINKIREVDYHLKLNNQVLHIDTKAPENLTAIPVANI